MSPSDLQRAIAYGESELGEIAILKPSDNTYTINRARDGVNILPPGTAATTVRAKVAVIHPSVLKINT